MSPPHLYQFLFIYDRVVATVTTCLSLRLRFVTADYSIINTPESGKQNTIKTNSNTATKIKGVNGADKNKDKDVQNENEEENENEKENETAIEMLLKGRNGI